MPETVLKGLAFFAIASSVGWILLFLGLGARRDKQRIEEREHTRTTGRIIDYVGHEVPHGRRGTRIYWKPVVEFTAEGQTYRLHYFNRMDQKQYPAGKSVDVIYDVGDPTHFHLVEDEAFNKGGRSAMKFGLILILCSAVLAAVLAVLLGGAAIV